MNSGEKRCPRCGESKPLDEFWNDASTRDGKVSHCIACGKRYYEENRDRILQRQKDYYAANPGVNSERSRRYRAKHRKEAVARAKRNHVERVFCMTVEEYDATLARGCAICGSHNRMHMDHCHATGQVRGPLCQQCNHMIGNARDLPQRLEAGAAYLRRHQTTSSRT